MNVWSTYRFQNEGLILAFINHFSSKSHIKMLAETGPNGELMATPSIWWSYENRVGKPNFSCNFSQLPLSNISLFTVLLIADLFFVSLFLFFVFVFFFLCCFLVKDLCRNGCRPGAIIGDRDRKSWDARRLMIWENFSIFRTLIHTSVLGSSVDAVTLRDQMLRVARFSG